LRVLLPTVGQLWRYRDRPDYMVEVISVRPESRSWLITYYHLSCERCPEFDRPAENFMTVFQRVRPE
jgi:hypothetical protein